MIKLNSSTMERTKKLGEKTAKKVLLQKQKKMKGKIKARTIQKQQKMKGKIKSRTIPDAAKVKLDTVDSDKPNGKRKAIVKGKKSKTNTKLKQLESLKEIDPDFHKFLQKNDKELLDFDLYDSDDSSVKDKEVNNTTEVDDQDDQHHKPDAQLQVASDESDFENSDEEPVNDGTPKITLKLLKEWQIELEKPNVSVVVIRQVIQAFSAALSGLSIETSKSHTQPSYKALGAGVFNGIITLCVLHLQAAILRFLNVDQKAKLPLYKTKKWPKLRSCLRYYFNDLIRLIDHVSSSNILSVLLKHLHQMAAMLVAYSHLSITILKKLIKLWATADETVRVSSFLCILKITRHQQMSMLNNVIKAMYLSYVRNTMFVSPSTLPMINFMRRSFVEILALDLDVAYQHVFLYIRQLAIHLRNAIILKKKGSYQMVYNWRYVNSLRLWVDLLVLTADQKQLQPLIYPLFTIISGVIRLIPTAQYFPLRFHCVKALITLSKGTNTYIPLFAFILEVLRSDTFNAKHTIVSMKPMQFTCILRLNKAQLAENAFRDEVIEQVFGLSLEHMAAESASIGFPDLRVIPVFTLKSYIKKCKNPNYSRKIKQLIDIIEDNARFIEQERRTFKFELKETERIQAWETEVRNKGTPLDVYYNSWLKTQQVKKRRQAFKTDNVANDYEFLKLKKDAGKKPVVSCKNNEGDVELFPSDSEDSSEDEEHSSQHSSDVEVPQPNKMKKIQNRTTNGNDERNEDTDSTMEICDPEAVDIVKDLDFNDW